MRGIKQMIKYNGYIDKTFRFFMDMLYPPRCAVCGNICDETGSVCDKCRNVFSLVRNPRCLKCGKQLDGQTVKLCMDCSKKKHHYICGFPLWNYNRDIRKSIAYFKYQNRCEYAVFYARQMVRYLGKYLLGTGAQYFIPVPIHSSKKRVRGYNQAQILADELSKYLGIPVLSDVLLRNRKTAPQKELSDIERLKNLVQAFEINSDNDVIRKENITNVMLVDDIYTTGSTVEACTKALMDAGVEKVFYTSICIGKGF